MRRVINVAAVAAVVGLLLTATGQAAEPNCLPWASAAPVIKQNFLLPGRRRLSTWRRCWRAYDPERVRMRLASSRYQIAEGDGRRPGGEPLTNIGYSLI